MHADQAEVCEAGVYLCEQGGVPPNVQTRGKARQDLFDHTLSTEIFDFWELSLSLPFFFYKSHNKFHHQCVEDIKLLPNVDAVQRGGIDLLRIRSRNKLGPSSVISVYCSLFSRDFNR